MKHKFFSLLVAIAASVGMMNAEVINGTCGESLTWTLDENGLLTISGIGTMWDFESEDYGAQVPWDASKITSVVIEEGVTTIGDNAFNMTTGWNANEQVYSHYDGPQTVNLPNSLTSIGKSAFMNCTNVEYLFIPANVVDIYNQAFYGCSSLKVIKVESPIPARLLDKYDDEILELWDVVPWEYIFPSYDNLIFYVPCGSRDAYVQAWGMDYHHYYYGTYSSDQTQVREHFLYPPLKYTIECTANDSNLGETTFPLTSCDEMILTATPKSGCHFVKWSDGVEDNPRSIELTQDTAFKGIFARNPVITFKCNDEQGYIEGETSTPTGMASGNISIAAYPFRGYHFITWADGNIDNPRTIMLTQDTIMEAIFDYTLNGKCGKNEALTWTLDTTNMALAISGSGELTENYTYIRQIESVTIGNEITSIGEYAFASFNHLNSIILGTNVKAIEQYAFASAYSYTFEDEYTERRTYPTITCYSQRPPTVRENAFDYDMPYSTIVYVPADYVSTYKAHDFWGLYDVRPLGAKPVETDEVNVTPTATTAEFIWPSVNGAATYELVIKDKSGNVICTLTFNANGQLIQLAFHAPARDKAVNHTGFLFTVTGLEEGTTYDYTIVSKDSNGNVLDTQSGSFTTTGEQGIENVDALSKSIKVIRNGQLLIEKNGKTYNIVGTEVK